ncbi:MAG: methyltransferase domain-containing protein [Phycisphaerales bacterium]|nr:MAG: methyltransferase domain-containing protein [Phycisphaerales bacterium]
MNTPTPVPHDAHATRDKVREGYATIAKAGSWNDAQSQRADEAQGSCCAPGGGCCGVSTMSADDLAQRIGYDAAQLAAIPAEANMGLSCGNPGAIAALREGEEVLDLGCGGGFDAFLCGPKVGASGRVIGVDMTPDMLAKARRGLEHYTRTSGLENVEFRLGEIEHLPVADASVDVVISNCVINLSPDKARVWREVARVLKVGGRVAVSDLVLLRPLPEAVASRLDALIGCIAGASLVDDMRAMMEAAGLTDITLTPKPGYVGALAGSGDPLYAEIAALLPGGTTADDFITSMDIAARKPA